MFLGGIRKQIRTIKTGSVRKVADLAREYVETPLLTREHDGKMIRTQQVRSEAEEGEGKVSGI